MSKFVRMYRIGKLFYKIVFVFVSFCVLVTRVSAQQGAGVDSLIQDHNNRAVQFLNAAKYDECVEEINAALKIQDNPVSRFYLGHVYLIEKKYAEAIKNSEAALQLNPGLSAAYSDLFYAYEQSGRWKEAKEISDKLKQANPGLNLSADLESIDSGIESQGRSPIFVILLFAGLIAIFFRPIYLASKKQNGFSADAGNIRLSEAVLISASVSCAMWLLFFALSHWIWSLNPHYPAADFTPIVRIFIFEQDGAESFALYSLMFASIFGTLLITPLILKARQNQNQYLGVFTVLLLIAGFYMFSIGFYPPLQAVDSKSVPVAVVLGLLAGGLYFVYQKKTIIAMIAAIVLMAFAGLIAIGPPSLTDLQFIIDPALRLMHGFKVSDIYFQYDLFLSFLAIAWMKMNTSLEMFPYLGQVSFFLFYIGIFFFSDRFFKSRGLSVVFILALMIMRFYSISGDVPTIMQVTPLRLDLWLLLLLVANKKGVSHWLVGLVLGLLVIFHRNLGLIYLVSYAELLIGLFVIDVLNLVKTKQWSGKSFSELFVKHLKTNLVNIMIVLVSIGLCFVLFHEFFSKSAMIYRKLGIGMLPISKISFYWYVPVLLGTLISFVFYYRDKLGEKYTSLALFITLLVIGNSMYFFGRSHENNILNITGILVLALFVLFDLLIFLAPTAVAKVKDAPVVRNKKGQSVATAPITTNKPSLLAGQNVYVLLPVLFTAFIGYFYGQRISEKLNTQYTNLTESTFYYPFPDYPKDITPVKKLTNNSQDVYFLDLYYDAFYYYNGNYAPLGYFSPASSWVFKKDIIDFMQDLLNRHYYVVYVGQFASYYKEYLPLLKYNKVTELNGWVALQKVDVPLLLPETLPSQYHMGIMDTLGNNGIDFGGIALKDSFTIEAVVKPEGPQLPNAVIMSNLNRVNGAKGFTIQANNNFPDKYVFAFSNGSTSIPNVVFDLENGKWHYLTIVVNRQEMKIYDNGRLLSNNNPGGLPYLNSDLPLTIGNQGNKDSRFRGEIREVNISNGNLDDTAIARNAEKVAATLK